MLKDEGTKDMIASSIIPETDVLISTVIYLVERGVTPYHFSIPRGRGVDTQEAKRKLDDAFRATKISPSFSNEGADILALSETEWWHIECKGAGSGKPQTQRTNFDRALSSVVSYYGEDNSKLPKKCDRAIQYLGLALPETEHYIRELKRRVRKPLRQRLNLWILLYDIGSGKIKNGVKSMFDP